MSWSNKELWFSKEIDIWLPTPSNVELKFVSNTPVICNEMSLENNLDLERYWSQEDRLYLTENSLSNSPINSLQSR